MSTRWASGAPRSRVRAPGSVKPPQPDRGPPAAEFSLAGRAAAMYVETGQKTRNVVLTVG
jgi:hypothetical protein